MKVNIDLERLKKNFFTFNNVCEKLNDKEVKSLLYESYNMYDGIYEDIDKLYAIVSDMIKSNKFNVTYTYPFESKSLVNVDTLSICIYAKNDTLAFDGSCTLNSNVLDVELVLSTFVRYLSDEVLRDKLVEMLEPTLVHELTHAKNDSEIENKSGVVNNNPDWYNVATKYMINNGANYGDYLSIFFYALYMSYYGEVQAVSAEITSEVDNAVKKIGNWNELKPQEKVNKINEIMSNVKIVKDVNDIVNRYIPVIKNNAFPFKANILNYFAECGMPITEAQLEKYYKQIDFGLNRLTAKIRRGLNYVYQKYGLIK